MFGKRVETEEYELTDRNLNVDIERQHHGHSEDEGNSSNRSSEESSTSHIFLAIDNLSKGAGTDDFTDKLTFNSVVQKYDRILSASKKYMALAGLCGLMLWISMLIWYSRGSYSRKSQPNGITFQPGDNSVSLSPFNPQNQNLTLDVLRLGKTFSFRAPIRWLTEKQVPEDKLKDGLYLIRIGDAYVVKSSQTDYSYTILESSDFTYNGQTFTVADIHLNPSKHFDSITNNFLIIETDITNKWRKLKLSLYWKYEPDKKIISPLALPDDDDNANELIKLQFASFSPGGSYVLYCYANNLYLTNGTIDSTIQITYSGSPEIFNGVTDWIYEEEVIGDDKLFWWSPDEENLLFATLNDTMVSKYDLDYYVKEPGSADDYAGDTSEDNFKQYPSSLKINYPKVGTNNPALSMFNYHIKENKISELDFKASSVQADSILYEASWIDNDNFLMKTTDRTSSYLTKTVFKPLTSELKEVANEDAASYNGWISKTNVLKPIPIDSDHKFGYIDRVVFNNQTHLALFPGANSSNPRILTNSAKWSVLTESPIAYDHTRNLLYFVATIRSSMDAHLMALDISKKDNNLINVTDTSKDGYYDIQFSHSAKFLSLSYMGPFLPWQKLIDMEKLVAASGDQSSYVLNLKYLESQPPINNYKQTETSIKEINLPTKTYRTMKVGTYSDGEDIIINFIEILPPGFKRRGKKYPLLVYAYGGPGIQTVNKEHSIDFQSVVSASLNAIVLIIDPKGTGGQSWKFQSIAYGKLGYNEPRDISLVTSEYIKQNKPIINTERTAIWGWSYGGFTSLKTLEYDKGETFKYGIAVAPVTNWLFYDSIYTERYMGMPESNPNYSKYARINDFDNFKSAKRFLIMHGTADDNVHIQNLLWLMDKFNSRGVENYDVHFFPDSDHSIYFHNANTIVYDKLLHWLYDAFTGKFDSLK